MKYFAVILILSSFLVYGQGDRLHIDFQNITESSMLNNKLELKKYSSIYLDNTDSYENLKKTCSSISKIEEIESIIITDYNDSKIPEELAECKYLRRITFLNTNELNVKTLVKYLSKLPDIQNLNLGNCKIETIPSEIKNCTQLKSINISMNNMLNLEESIDALKNCPMLESISLPVNQISELPANINELTRLKELNLANNNLTDLPDGMEKMDSLQSIIIQRNIIISPLKTYDKLNKLNIKYLSIDEVTDDELKELQKLFPNAEITQTEKPNTNLTQLHKQIKDSIHNDVMRSTFNNTSEEEALIVKKRESIDLKAFSLSYLQYAQLFDPIIHKDPFTDTLLFDERYVSEFYYNVFRHQPGLEYDFFKLKKTKPLVRGQFWFEFEMSKYFYYNFPEYFAFKDMQWVLIEQEEGYKVSFKKLIKEEKFTDFRLYFNEELKSFTLELKSKEGFVSAIVVPRPPKKEELISEVQATYEVRYLKYLEGLNKRRNTFNKEQKNKLINYRLQVNKLHADLWKSFKSLHLSEEEKRLSQKDWLLYYDEVVANEKTALLNAGIENEFIERYFEVMNIKVSDNFSDTKSIYQEIPCGITFTDIDDKPLIVSQLYVYDPLESVVKMYSGSQGLMEFNVFKNELSRLNFIAVLRNGDLAVGNNDVPLESANVIKMDVFPKNLTVLYDLMKQIKLL